LRLAIIDFEMNFKHSKYHQFQGKRASAGIFRRECCKKPSNKSLDPKKHPKVKELVSCPAENDTNLSFLTMKNWRPPNLSKIKHLALHFARP